MTTSDDPGLERLDRVLIIGGNEHNLRCGLHVDQPPRHLEAGQAGAAFPIVVPDPYGHHELRIDADRPAVAEAEAGAGLPGDAAR